MLYKKHVEIAKQAAVLAGEKIMEIYATDFDKTIEIKADDSPLTIADKSSNNIIVEMLKSNFPDISILSEESAEDETRFSNDLCWVIDPLDGTKEFIKKNDEFTVNIALAYKHKVVMGVIYIPVTKILYYGAVGMGAYKEFDNVVNEIKVSTKQDNLILVGSRTHASDKLKALMAEKTDLIDKTISAGSSLKGTMVAEGVADIYYRFAYTSEWDTAAMQCIVEQAGGIFMQMDGSIMTYNRHNHLNEKGFYIVNRKENIWV